VNDPTGQGRSHIILILAIILAGLLTIQTTVLILFAIPYFQATPKLLDTLSDFFDAQIDAGREDPTLNIEEPLLRDRKILLFHDVNSRTAKDVSARLIYLNSVDPKAPIDLYISTQGGWEDNAFTIIDTMRTISAPVNTWAVGGCYSAGALILVAATGRRYATEDAILMIHTNLDDSTDAYSYPPLARERYERVYRNTTSLPSSWYPMTDDSQHYLSPKQALEFRIVDEIAPVWGAKREPAKPAKPTSRPRTSP
jgi:ATP-dependent protease ClpP protease subunit